MTGSELSISVGELLGVPRVTLSGCMDGWHDHALSGVLAGFRDQEMSSLVLDIVGLNFVGVDGATSMVNVLRSIGPSMCVHIIASGTPNNYLRRAELGASVRLYCSTDEIAEYLSPSDECLTSRWMALGTDDNEMPLAA